MPSQRYTTRVRLCVAVVENRPETTLIAPPGLADAFAAGRALMDRQSATPTQNILAEFIGEGHFATHLRKMRVLYAERRDALIRALELHCTDALDWGEQSPEAGLHLVGKMRSAAKPESDMDVWEAAMRVGLQTPPLSPHYRHGKQAGLIIGFAATQASNMQDAARRLCRAIKSTRA